MERGGRALTWVYLLQRHRNPSKRCIGLTDNVAPRIRDDNTGKAGQLTATFAPRKAVVMVGFEQRSKAEAFEHYLKSGSGHAFARRHFW